MSQADLKHRIFNGNWTIEPNMNVNKYVQVIYIVVAAFAAASEIVLKKRLLESKIQNSKCEMSNKSLEFFEKE